MNSLETDMRRAVLSPGFLLGAGGQFAVLWAGGFGSALYKMSVPLVCALPYACGWLDEWAGGFWKFSLPRGTRRGYIWGKYLACTLSGAGAELLAAWLYSALAGEEAGYAPLALSAMVWAGTAAVLAAASNSRYLAYGGGFVVYYFLVILCERYWPGLYCLYPYEWLNPAHAWPFGERGSAALLLAIWLALGLFYNLLLERRLSHG